MPLGTPLRRMPLPEDVGDLLADLIGKPTAVSKARAFDFTEEPERWLTARYVDDEGVLIGACLCDLPFAATSATALALIPAVVAKEAIEAGSLEPGLRENVYEVVNIMSKLLNGPSVPHLRLTEFVDGIPDDARRLVERAPGRKHYDVTVVGYPNGRIALIGS
jgi:hypothetical protein